MNFRLKLPLLLTSFLSLAAAQNLFSQKEESPANTADEYEKQYQERIKKDKLGGVYIPKNLEEACAALSKLSSPESQAKFKKVAEDSVCMYFHASLGKWMIVNWSFYEGSRFSHYLRTAGVTYPDDMVDFVIIGWHRQLNGKPLEIKQLFQFIKERRQRKVEREQAEKLKTGEILHQETRKRAANGN